MCGPFACGSGPGRPRFPGRSLLKEGDVRPLSQLAPMGVGPRQRTRPLGTAEIRPVLLCGTPNTSVDTREVPPSCLKEAPAYDPSEGCSVRGCVRGGERGFWGGEVGSRTNEPSWVRPTPPPRPAGMNSANWFVVSRWERGRARDDAAGPCAAAAGALRCGLRQPREFLSNGFEPQKL